MNEIIIQHARDYALKHHLQLAERLGFGMHGIIYITEANPKDTKTAVKAHREPEPYFRECAVFERLAQAKIIEILGCSVPEVIKTDDELLVIEMSVVTRPFVLDFAGAYLDKRPEFSAEIWEDWETQKRDQFEHQWPKVQRILGELEGLGIYMVDVSPSNIALLD